MGRLTKKQKLINGIKSIIEEWGGATTSELELGCSPIYNQMGKNNFALVERFNRNGVTVIHYVHDNEVDDFDVDYQELKVDLLEEIYQILEQYNVEQQKTMDRCKDENF
jgi:hypothetical protein